MGFRFFKRVRVGKGLWLNLSKSGPSITAGIPGLKTTFGRRGTRTTVGLPGTGLSYSRQSRAAVAVPGWLGGLVALGLVALALSLFSR